LELKMAHFAEIDSNNVVLQVLAVADEHEHRGQEFLADDCGLGGTWIQTSYNNNIRGQFAGIGYIYDSNADRFYCPSPFPSWVLDDNYEWQAPSAKPVVEGKIYIWDEATLSWVERESTND